MKKKQYLSPFAGCLPVEAQSELLANTSFDGIGIDSITENTWDDGVIVDFPGIL